MRGAPVEVLQRVLLFADLNKREVRKIAREFKLRRFAKGEIVVREGSAGAAFFVIESGEATVFVGGSENSTLKPSDYFGEIALFDEGPRTATIVLASVFELVTSPYCSKSLCNCCSDHVLTISNAVSV